MPCRCRLAGYLMVTGGCRTINLGKSGPVTQIESGVAHGKQVGGARAPGTVEEQNLLAQQQILPEGVVSGGQTGADQAGLIAARRFGIPTGGWMPKGFLTTTGPAPDLAREFGLREHSGGYADRTEANLRLPAGTLRFAASSE